MKKLLFLITSFALLMAACSMPSESTPEGPSPEELAMTIIAQTQTAEAAAFTATPLPPTETPVPEDTPTPSVPVVSVSVATNCRTGPDVVYDLILVFQPGATAEVVGKYQAPNYWIIKTPTNETCWLWGEYATVSGNTASLAEMAPPPPPVVVAPTETPDNGGGGNGGGGAILVTIAAPNNFKATASCQVLNSGGSKILQGKMDTLSWDPVNGATGYTIYLDGVEFTNVGGMTSSFNVNAFYEKAKEYGIETRTASGKSATVTIPAPACP